MPISFPVVIVLLLVSLAVSARAQVERYYQCAFKDGAQTVRERPDGAWDWTYPLTLDEEVMVSLYGGEGSLQFKTFTLPAEIVTGGVEDPFVNELVLRGGDTFTNLQKVQYTHVMLILSDSRQGISAALSYTSQSNSGEYLTISTGTCEEVY